MFALGHIWIGDYKVWITTPVFTVSPLDSSAPDLPYHEVMVTREERVKNDKWSFYTHLIKDDKFKFLFDLDERGQPTKHTDELAYKTYLERKDMQMPLWKLSKTQIDSLLRMLLSLSYECT